jgi:DnaJ-class molecular chaperone
VLACAVVKEAAMKDGKHREKPPAQQPPNVGSRLPGDEASPGSPQTGEHICPACSGAGKRAGAPCPECGGTGKVMAIVGDA